MDSPGVFLPGELMECLLVAFLALAGFENFYTNRKKSKSQPQKPGR